jgi:uncharacterized membrane protein YvbJ
MPLCPNCGQENQEIARYCLACGHFTEGEQALKELGSALDPDDQSELDWLSGQMQRIRG